MGDPRHRRRGTATEDQAAACTARRENRPQTHSHLAILVTVSALIVLSRTGRHLEFRRPTFEIDGEPATVKGWVAGAPTRPVPEERRSGHNATTSALCRSSITKCFGISRVALLQRHSTGNRAKRMCGPSQLGVCTVTSPRWLHLLQRVRCRSTSLDASGPTDDGRRQRYRRTVEASPPRCTQAIPC